MGWRANMAPYAHPGNAEDPKRTVWGNGPNEGKTLADAPPTRIRIDHAAAEQERVERRWAELEDVGRMRVRAKRHELEKMELDARIELAEMQKQYPAEFTLPGSGRPPWFYAAVVGVCLLQLTLLLVLVAHVTRPPLPKGVENTPPEAPKVASAQGRGDAQKGGRQ